MCFLFSSCFPCSFPCVTIFHVFVFMRLRFTTFFDHGYPSLLLLVRLPIRFGRATYPPFPWLLLSFLLDIFMNSVWFMFFNSFLRFSSSFFSLCFVLFYFALIPHLFFECSFSTLFLVTSLSTYIGSNPTSTCSFYSPCPRHTPRTRYPCSLPLLAIPVFTFTTTTTTTTTTITAYSSSSSFSSGRSSRIYIRRVLMTLLIGSAALIIDSFVALTYLDLLFAYSVIIFPFFLSFCLSSMCLVVLVHCVGSSWLPPTSL